MAFLRAISRAVLDFCFPWTCAACGAGYEGERPLCDRCDAELAELESEPVCGACAVSLPMEGSPCPYCLGKAPTNFERVARLSAFHEPLRRLIHHLKYHRRWSMGETLGERLFRRDAAKVILSQVDVLVPVPLHWRRQIPRGYNQAEVLARHLGKLSGKPVARAVRRVLHTGPQTRLHSAAQREANLKGAFRLIRPGPVAGRRVAVIDDVWTTGATMQAVARAIKQAKPKAIYAVVLARTDPRGVERQAATTRRGAPVAEVELDP